MGLDAVGGIGGFGGDVGGFTVATTFGGKDTNGLIKAGAVPPFSQHETGLVHLAALPAEQRALAAEFSHNIDMEKQRIRLAQASARGIPGLGLPGVTPPALIPGTKENKQMTEPLHWGLRQLFRPAPIETPDSVPDAPPVALPQPRLNDWSGSFSDRELGLAPRSITSENIIQPSLHGRPAEPLPSPPPLITPIPPVAAPQVLITPMPEQARPEAIGGGFQTPDVPIGQEALVPPAVPDTSILMSTPAPGDVTEPAGSGQLHGSGPAPGVIEVSERARSLRAFEQMRGGEFIFDPDTHTFLAAGERVGGPGAHPRMADTIGADRSRVVGGQFSRGANGELTTDEMSGHFYRNWTNDIRAQFKEFMERMTGRPVQHSP